MQHVIERLKERAKLVDMDVDRTVVLNDYSTVDRGCAGSGIVAFVGFVADPSGQAL